MAEEKTIAEVGEGTIAKYKLTAEATLGTSVVNLHSKEVLGWEFKVTGSKPDGVIIMSGGTNVIEKVDEDNEDNKHYVVFIDTNQTGTGILKGRVTMMIKDTDYDDGKGGNIRPEVSLAFDVLKVS